MSSVKIDDTNFCYQLDGPEDRPLVVLSHALSVSHKMWVLQIPALAKHYRVLSYDMRGHGFTDATGEDLTRGYTLNRQRFEANARELEAALKLVRKAAQSPELKADTSRGLVDIVSRYAQTFLLLQRYDEGLLSEPQTQAGGTLPTMVQARAALTTLKTDLMARGEATALFAQERGEAFDALMGNLEQTVFGEPAYPTVEAKAAHLLYFVIKNHPFSDGNKRSGAFLFVDFLNRNGRLLDAAGVPGVLVRGARTARTRPDGLAEVAFSAPPEAV